MVLLFTGGQRRRRSCTRLEIALHHATLAQLHIMHMLVRDFGVRLQIVDVDSVCFLGVVELVSAHIETHFEIVHLLLSRLFLSKITVVLESIVALIARRRLALFGHAQVGGLVIST